MDYLSLIAQIAGSAAGQAASQMDRDEVMRLIRASVDGYGKINVPKLQELVLKQAPNTQLAGIKDDPIYRGQQNDADAQLNDIINSGGLTLTDKAALNSLRNRTTRTEAAGRDAITNDMAARGTLDSGSMLAMQLQGNQQSANSLAAGDESAAAQAQARAFDAIRERGRNAATGLDRDYRQKSEAARAQDAINQGNIAIANAGAQYNAGLPQRDFDNQLRLTGAKSQADYALAGAHGANAKSTQDFYSGLGNMAGSALKSKSSSSITGPNADYSGSDKNLNSFDQGFGTGGSAGGSSPEDWNSYPDNALSGESTRSDGSENYEVDPATGKIRRKQNGVNF